MNIEVANQQQTLKLDAARLREAVQMIAAEAGYCRSETRQEFRCYPLPKVLATFATGKP